MRYRALILGLGVLALSGFTGGIRSGSLARDRGASEVVPGDGEVAVREESESGAQVATKLRGMYFARDYEGATVEGRKYIGQHSAPSEARAWYLLSLGTIFGEREGAIAESEQWVAARPEDPWARFALAGTLDENYDRFREALPASRKAYRLAKGDSDFVWLHAMILSESGRPQEAMDLIDRSLPLAGNRAELLVLRASSLLAMSRGERPIEAIRAGASTQYERSREADPSNVNAHFQPGSTLAHQRRFAEALPLLRRAAALSPFSTQVHQELWNALIGQPDVAPENARAEVEADIRALLHARGDYPGTLLAVSEQYGEMKLNDPQKEIEDRILKEFSDSREAEVVLMNRVMSFGKEHMEDAKTPAVRAELREMLEDFVRRPDHQLKSLLGSAYLNLFFTLKDDPAVKPDELLEAIHGMLRYVRGNLHNTYPEAARALADRKVHLEEAEKIVRDGFAAVKRQAEKDRARHPGSRKMQKDWARSLNGLMLDASGWVKFNQGKPEEAAEDLTRARKLLQKKSEVNLYHLGRLSESNGDLDQAEELYGEGMTIQTPMENPCDAALRDLYARRRGDLEGFDSYAANFKNVDRAKRKEQILAERITAPEPIPAFDLKGLDGARISAQKLQGKILVIHFWGVWCGWCLKEMQDIQKLHDKYRNDPEVAILTIDNDPSPETVREWMKEKGFTFPVLLDEGYVSSKASIRSFPTTWFVDRQERKAFVRIGWSKELLEEFDWRINALREVPPS